MFIIFSIDEISNFSFPPGKDVLPCFYYLGYLFGKGVENRVNVNKEQCLSLLSKGAESGHEGCKSLLAYFKKEFNNSDQDTNTTN